MNRTKIRIAAGCALVLSWPLAGCGGGGDGDGPVQVTVTCPNGMSRSAATVAEAQAACPPPALVSVNPADGATGVEPEGFGGVRVETDSQLDVATLTTANVGLKAGGVNAVAGSVEAVGGKGLRFVPALKLNYGQSYRFTANVKDSLGRGLSVDAGFATAPVACPAPQTWNTALSACVYPMGVTIRFDHAEYLKPVVNCTDTAANCWRDAVADGRIRFIATAAREPGQPSRPVVLAAYLHEPENRGLGPLERVVRVFYADTGEARPFAGLEYTKSYGFDSSWKLEGSAEGWHVWGGRFTGTVPAGYCSVYVWQTEPTARWQEVSVSNDLGHCPDWARPQG